MKNAILFSLFFFAQCLIPTTISAITLPSDFSHVVVPKKKMSLQKKVNYLLASEPTKKLTTQAKLILIGLLLILLGIIILNITGNQTSSPTAILPPNLGARLLGSTALVTGIFLVIRGFFPKKKKPKQIP